MKTGPELGLMGLGGFFSECDEDPQEGLEQRRNMVRFTFNTALWQLCGRGESRRQDNECYCWSGGDKNWGVRGVMGKALHSPHPQSSISLGKGDSEEQDLGQQASLGTPGRSSPLSSASLAQKGPAA